MFKTSHTNDKDKVKIILVCDFALDRDAIRKLLASEKGMEIIEWDLAQGDIGDLLLMYPQADIIILDLEGTDFYQIEASKLTAEQTTGPKIILLSEGEDSEKVVNGIRSSGVGYVLKSSGAKGLLKSLRHLTDKVGED